jgi:CubicO group peptidase (beta-lactamase class C family)
MTAIAIPDWYTLCLMARADAPISHHRIRAAVIVIAIGVLPLMALAPPSGNVDEYLDAQLRRQRIAGLSLAIIQDGQLIKARGYGSSNLETGAPASAETVYKIGSLSKSFLGDVARGRWHVTAG